MRHSAAANYFVPSGAIDGGKGPIAVPGCDVVIASAAIWMYGTVCLQTRMKWTI